MRYIFPVILVVLWGCSGRSKEGYKEPDSILIMNGTGTIGLVNGDSAALKEFNRLIPKTFQQYSQMYPVVLDTMADVLDANWHDVAVKIHGKWHVFNDSATIETLISGVKLAEKRADSLEAALKHAKQQLTIQDNHGKQTINF